VGESRKPRWSNVRAVRKLLSVLMLSVVVGAGACTDSSDSMDSFNTSGPPSPSSPTASPEAELTKVKDLTTVPNVVGLDVSVARQRASASGFRLDPTWPSGKVSQQYPPAGEQWEEGTIMRVEVAPPKPRVPDVTGERLASARRELERKGFGVYVRKQDLMDAPAGTVIAQRPHAGAVIRAGGLVTLIVVKGPAPPFTDESLPPASDYDCEGGAGDEPNSDGPHFVRGRISIVGADQYGLDEDGDGVGCE
jgi:hypothetical protein